AAAARAAIAALARRGDRISPAHADPPGGDHPRHVCRPFWRRDDLAADLRPRHPPGRTDGPGLAARGPLHRRNWRGALPRPPTPDAAGRSNPVSGRDRLRDRDDLLRVVALVRALALAAAGAGWP